jgi:hypothetical protein
MCRIKKAARRTPGSANGGIGGGGGGGSGGLFSGLKTSTTPSLGFGIGGLPGGLGAGSLGRAPLSSIGAGGQSNVMMSFNKKPATMDSKYTVIISSLYNS